MRLVVLGSAPLHDLSSWVTRNFSDVPVSYPGVTSLKPQALAPAASIAANFDSNWFRLYRTVPVAPNPLLVIAWVLPSVKPLWRRRCVEGDV